LKARAGEDDIGADRKIGRLGIGDMTRNFLWIIYCPTFTDYSIGLVVAIFEHH